MGNLVKIEEGYAHCPEHGVYQDPNVKVERGDLVVEMDGKHYQSRYCDECCGLKEIPCKFCTKPTKMVGTKMCDDCWEVEHRLARFIQSEGGRKYVTEILKGSTV